jgi:hypothetical protein
MGSEPEGPRSASGDSYVPDAEAAGNMAMDGDRAVALRFPAAASLLCFPEFACMPTNSNRAGAGHETTQLTGFEN